MTRTLTLGALVLLAATGLWWASRDRGLVLGPADGHDLSPADTGRVAVADAAPDFTLLSREGEAVTLSDFRGERDVVLVFYRGHW